MTSTAGHTSVVVFTDLENSTLMPPNMPGNNIIEQNAAYRTQILEPHRERVRQLLSEHQGFEREAPGDGFLLEFPNPIVAAQFAIAVQRIHQQDPILDGQRKPIRVKIGMQMAYPNPASEINYAARVTAFATGGQILISESLYVQLKEAEMRGVDFHLHGIHSLKGIGDKPLYELLYDGKSPQATKNQPVKPSPSSVLSPEQLERQELEKEYAKLQKKYELLNEQIAGELNEDNQETLRTRRETIQQKMNGVWNKLGN